MNSVEQDQLRVDVWDFNPEENVSEKEWKAGKGLIQIWEVKICKTTKFIVAGLEISEKNAVFLC